MLALLAAAALAASPPTLTPEALQARYGRIRSLTADVVQTKEGRFWARPLESRVRLRYTPERIVWETVSPVHAVVVIEGTRLTVTGAGGRVQDLRGVGDDPRVGALLRFLRAVIALDLGAIERDYDLRYGAREIVATPRPSAGASLFDAVRLRFDDRLELVGMEIDTPAEKTRLAFERLVRDPPPPAGGPEPR
jgi:hypothetical protein